MTNLFREETPIELHQVNGLSIFVKRDDLYGNLPAPPLAKLRGLRLILEQAYEGGTRLVGCWDTRVSKLGQGLAACCKEFPGMSCIVSYPTKQGEAEPTAIKSAAALGARIYPLPGGRTTICFAKARKHVEARGGLMLPFGLECIEAVEGVKKEARRTPIDVLREGTLVLCCGSGVTLAGLLSGLPILPRKIVGISSGRSLSKIMFCLKRYVNTLPEQLELHEAEMPYSKALTFPAPFPAHPNYDLKAWKFLIDNLQSYQEPFLFWNIGA
ncbi:MAG: pyridoxal-phosphate dependent enzyme [Acidobacteriota bacterium]|nr:pyridoxal-phosphate dependent enzyme [Acidobacteriota bacterium]